MPSDASNSALNLMRNDERDADLPSGTERGHGRCGHRAIGALQRPIEIRDDGLDCLRRSSSTGGEHESHAGVTTALAHTWPNTDDISPARYRGLLAAGTRAERRFASVPEWGSKNALSRP